MSKISYRDTIGIDRAGCSDKLNAVLYDMGCITIGDVLNTPIRKLLSNKALLDMWDEYSEFVLRVHTARGSINR